mmetsp:Transcript_3488/g.21923  ORF Transcript_3488/g.21923 Transcript_3488/m.21923 type:complete len:227 (-) Transcript_3488:254-934(-)
MCRRAPIRPQYRTIPVIRLARHRPLLESGQWMLFFNGCARLAPESDRALKAASTAIFCSQVGSCMSTELCNCRLRGRCPGFLQAPARNLLMEDTAHVSIRFQVDGRAKLAIQNLFQFAHLFLDFFVLFFQRFQLFRRSLRTFGKFGFGLVLVEMQEDFPNGVHDCFLVADHDFVTSLFQVFRLSLPRPRAKPKDGVAASSAFRVATWFVAERFRRTFFARMSCCSS